MGNEGRECRLWWPNHLSSTLKPQCQSSTFFFGWFFFSQNSIDIVVAFSADESEVSPPKLQEIHHANGNMSFSLQEKCKISLLGYYSSNASKDGHIKASVSDGGEFTNLVDHEPYFHNGKDSFQSKTNRPVCGCDKIDWLINECKLASVQHDPFFQLSFGQSETCSKLQGIPELHHLHWNGNTMFQLDLHVIHYEVPKCCSHHYSLTSQRRSANMGSSAKKPSWFEDLKHNPPHFDLDAVILGINSANAAKINSENHILLKRSTTSSKVLWRFISAVGKVIAAIVASLATSLFIILQFVHLLLSNLSWLGIYILTRKIFRSAFAIIELRCCQFLYWPILLQNHGFRSQSCVEYAEKIALRRHSTWSCVVVDVFLGNLFGIALWLNAESACQFIVNFAGDITNYLLRDGCVWLMGNPAGFKLNTELATVLGMVSLNAIQIWSTLWSLIGFGFVPMTKVIATAGFLFGFTASAGLIIDLILLLTRHIYILHWLLSLFYSLQIMALAALWRLFRERKWNPLRRRLDSFDYTVDQHIIGSLLFTPLLLLLPTTSVFYTFFAIINSVTSFICISIHFSISILHATPYNRVFLWLLKTRRFPSGIWFEIVVSDHSDPGSLRAEYVCSDLSPSKNSQKIQERSGAQHITSVSILHSNYLNLGEVVWPSYEDIFTSVSRSSIGSLVYGVLTGTRIPSAPGMILPSRLPWMTVPYTEYWHLCYEAIIPCGEVGKSVSRQLFIMTV